MTDTMLQFLQDINLGQLIGMALMFWFFYIRMEEKIEKNKKELKHEIEKSNDKIDKLSEKVEDVDRRLCRIEGSLQTHGHCLFNQTKNEHKAQ